VRRQKLDVADAFDARMPIGSQSCRTTVIL